jgi:hypothetical protein
MTEQEWLASTDAGQMLRFSRGRVSARKLQLFVTALGRRHPAIVDSYDAWRGLEMVERFADGAVSQGELLQHLSGFVGSLGAMLRIDSTHLAQAAEWLERGVVTLYGGKKEGLAHAELLRDIVGNPFRPQTLAPAWLESQEGLVPRLARVAYEERQLPAGTLDPARLAVLGDALEDASCTSEEVLGHLHDGGPHVRGCWVVDLCLGAS